MKRSTGRADSNGAEIFEGDIITSYHFTDYHGVDRYLEHRVIWSSRFAAWWCINLENEIDHGLEERHTGNTFLYVMLNEPAAKSVDGPEGVNKAMRRTKQ